MKKSLLIVLALSSMSVHAQKYMTKTGTINFSASTPLEKIEGVNKSSACLLDSKSGAIDFVIQIRSFVFEKQLMQEHFNENYMESEQFPKAIFKGSITNLPNINFLKDGEYNAEVGGKMTIHGVTKDVKTSGRIVVKNGKPVVISTFKIVLADYKIDIPKPVRDKVSKEAAINVNCALEPMK